MIYKRDPNCAASFLRMSFSVTEAERAVGLFALTGTQVNVQGFTWHSWAIALCHHSNLLVDITQSCFHGVIIASRIGKVFGNACGRTHIL